MKRVLVALLVGGAVFGTVFGLAASLGTVSSTSLGSGDTAVLSCDTDGINVAYNVVYNTTSPAGYKVDSVALSNVASACNNLSFKAQLTGTGSAALEEATGTLSVSGGNATINFNDSTPAKNVEDFHIVITG